MKAVGNNVVVRAVKRRAETKGGIVIPQNARILTQEGIVVGVGSGYVHPEDGVVIPITDVKVGDRVLYVRRSGQAVTVGEQEMRVLPYPSVVAVVDVGDDIQVCERCAGTGVVYGEDDSGKT